MCKSFSDCHTVIAFQYWLLFLFCPRCANLLSARAQEGMTNGYQLGFELINLFQLLEYLNFLVTTLVHVIKWNIVCNIKVHRMMKTRLYILMYNTVI